MNLNNPVCLKRVWLTGRIARGGFCAWVAHAVCLEPISKLLSAALGCKARGTALSAKRVLDVLQYASEPFPPSALPTNFSLDLASKLVLKWVLETGSF